MTKKALYLITTLFLLTFGCLIPHVPGLAKTIYISKDETAKLPSSGKWRVKNRKIAKVRGRTVTGVKKGTTYCELKKKGKREKVKIVVEQPYFNRQYVSKIGERIVLKGTKRHIVINDIDGDVFGVDYNEKTKNDFVEVWPTADDPGPGGAIAYIEAKVGKKKYTTFVYYGNILPYKIEVAPGKTAKMFDSATTKKINKKFHIANSAIATVDNHGRITGKRYGLTDVYFVHNGKKYYSKVLVIPNGSSESKIYSLMELSYFLTPNEYALVSKENLDFNIVHKFMIDSPETAGLYFPFLNKMEILDIYNTPDVMVHEYGHFIDDVSEPNGINGLFYSNSEEFWRIFENCSTEFEKGAYGRTDPTEYFAECFMIYRLNPYWMKKNMPKSYDWIHKFLLGHHYE